MVTTNREPQGLYPLFPNPVLAEGLLDRLLNSAYIIAMVGRSYRSQQRPGERAEDGSHPPRAGPPPPVYEAGKAAEQSTGRRGQGETRA
jgi:hypothetical protein